MPDCDRNNILGMIFLYLIIMICFGLFFLKSERMLQIALVAVTWGAIWDGLIEVYLIKVNVVRPLLNYFLSIQSYRSYLHVSTVSFLIKSWRIIYFNKLFLFVIRYPCLLLFVIVPCHKPEKRKCPGELTSYRDFLVRFHGPNWIVNIIFSFIPLTLYPSTLLKGITNPPSIDPTFLTKSPIDRMKNFLTTVHDNWYVAHSIIRWIFEILRQILYVDVFFSM